MGLGHPRAIFLGHVRGGGEASLKTYGSYGTAGLKASALEIDEVMDAVTALTTADLVRLRKIGAIYAVGRGVEGMDMVNDAISLALSGTRTCPRGVPFVVFLRNVMRSRASSERAKMKEEPMLESMSVGLDDRPSVLDRPSGLRNAEELMLARENAEARVKALESLFANDEDAHLVLMGDLDEMAATDIRALKDWSEQDYATVRRRMRRTLSAAFPNGWAP